MKCSFRKSYFWQQLIVFYPKVTERASYGLASSSEINKEYCTDKSQGNAGRLEDAALNSLEEMRMCQVKKIQLYTVDSSYANCKDPRLTQAKEARC